MKNNDFMREAMKCAIRAMKHDDVPIGAVIVKGGKIIARGENRVQKNSDPTKHAEMIAIRSACKKLEKKFLDDCEIYVTLEPCAMCATAISFARIRRVVYACDDPKGGGINFGAMVYDNDRHLFKPLVEKQNQHSEDSARLLKRFFKNLRVKKLEKSIHKSKRKNVKAHRKRGL